MSSMENHHCDHPIQNVAPSKLNDEQKSDIVSRIKDFNQPPRSVKLFYKKTQHDCNY